VQWLNIKLEGLNGERLPTNVPVANPVASHCTPGIVSTISVLILGSISKSENKSKDMLQTIDQQFQE